MKYYSLNKILQANCDYNVVFGERSNGKTFASLTYILERYLKGEGEGAYLRRWKEDLRAKRAQTLFASIVATGIIGKLSKGKYNNVEFVNGKWFLSKRTEKEKLLMDSAPFCYAFALSDVEHDKSTSYPNVTTIVFDEFLTRRQYIADEFVLFMNTLSTIIRDRNNVKIFMLGNTVNKYCPYFSEMGLRNVPNMSQGTIDVYQFGDNGASIAVEYAAPSESKKASNKFFCFDNENLKMITEGKWELGVYPRLPQKYRPKDVAGVFYIDVGSALLQANIIRNGVDDFIFIHQKTTPIKDSANQLIFSLNPDGNPLHRRKLLHNFDFIAQTITGYFATDKVYYQSNEIGELVRNYIRRSLINNLTS